MRGFLVGVIWGVVLIGGGLAGTSLYFPLPEQPGEAAVTPGSAPAVPLAPAVETPPSEAPPRAGVPDIGSALATEAPAPQPQPSVPATGLQDPAAEGAPAAPAATGAQAALDLPAGTQFLQPPRDDSPGYAAANDTTPPDTAPEGADVDGATPVPPQPDTTSAAQPEASQGADAAPVPAEAQAPDLSDTLDPGAPPPAFQPAPLGTPAPEVGAEPVQQLVPSDASAPLTRTEAALLRAEDTPDPTPVPEGPAPAVEEVPLAAAFVPALDAHAVPFSNPENKPLFAIILIDTPDTSLDRASLTGFSFPVAFAVDAAREDAAEVAAFYRDAGFEVLITADGLPRTGSPRELALAFEGARRAVPEAVALIDSPNSFLQRTPDALGPVLEELADTGHGFVAYPERLNAGEAAARRALVPAMTLYRQLDAEREISTTITRYLDRAAFNAAQSGQVIVIGHTYAQTVTALYAWRQSNRADAVIVAPISAVLLEMGRDAPAQ